MIRSNHGAGDAWRHRTAAEVKAAQDARRTEDARLTAAQRKAQERTR